MSSDSEEIVFDLDEAAKAIREVRTVRELEPLMVALNRSIYTSHVSFWDTLSTIVDLAKDRIDTITSLTDLGEGDDREEQNLRGKICNWFGHHAELLAGKYGLRDTAAGLLIELWNQLGEFQLSLCEKGELRHIYRAGLGMYLGRIYAQQEPGAAVWWLLHAHADDLLIPFRGGAAKDMLRLGFGVSADAFAYMQECASKNRASNEPHALLAEHIVMQLSLKPQHTHLFSRPTSLIEFPIGRAYAKSMIERVRRVPKGEPLEELSRYLILLLAGWVPTENLYLNRAGIDSDLVARYIREPEAISSAHGRAILAECKNIDRTLGVSGVGYFLYRMHLTQVNTGILFAKKNVSGTALAEEKADHANAEYLLDLAFQSDGRAVIVIDLDNIEELVKGTQTIWSLIDSGITGRRFGKPKQSAMNA